MPRWNLSIQDRTDRLVRSFLSRSGQTEADLSAFVEQACRSEILRRTVAEIRKQNAGLTADQALKLANEAVAAARTGSS